MNLQRVPRFAVFAIHIGLLSLLSLSPTTVQAQVNFNDLETGGCDPTLSQSDQCGGHGVCNATTRKCLCEDLWSANADFISVQDCPTSTIAVYVLWGINILEIIWILYSTAYVLVARAENYFEQRRVKKDYSLWKNKGLIAVLIYFLLGIPSHLTMAILHMVDPLTRVGFDLFPTILFMLGKAGLYLSSIFLQGPIIAAVLRGQDKSKELVRLNYILNVAVSCASLIVGSFAFITFDYFQGDIPKQIEIMRAYYYSQAATLIANGLQAYLVKRWVFQALDTARALVSSGDKTEHLKTKVGNLQGQIIKQGILQGIIYIVMGSVPFLLNKHQYFLPISWLAMPIIGKRLAFQFDLDKAGAKTIAARLGLKKSSAFDNSTTGSKKRRDGDNSFNMDATQTDKNSYQQGSQFGSTTGRKKQAKAGQVLSVALSDEEGGMQEILTDEKSALRDKFTEFVRSKYATEALVLYDACVRYQNLAQSGASKEELSKVGLEIITTHIKEGATQPVDMSASLRDSVLKLEEENSFDDKSFDQVKMMAFDLLKSNFYQHFAKTLQN